MITQLERKKCARYFGGLFCYWLLLTITGALVIYSKARLATLNVRLYVYWFICLLCQSYHYYWNVLKLTQCTEIGRILETNEHVNLKPHHCLAMGFCLITSSTNIFIARPSVFLSPLKVCFYGYILAAFVLLSSLTCKVDINYLNLNNHFYQSDFVRIHHVLNYLVIIYIQFYLNLIPLHSIRKRHCAILFELNIYV